MEDMQARSHSSMEALEIISLSDSDSEIPSLEASANGPSLDAAPCPAEHHPLSLPPSLDHLDDALHPAPTPNPAALNGLASDAILTISTISTTSSSSTCDPPAPQPQQQQQPTPNADAPPPGVKRTPSPLSPLERGAGAGAEAAAVGLADSDSASANEAPLMASPPTSPLDLVSPSMPQGHPSPFDADDLVDSDADELDGEAAELLLQQEVCSNRPTGLAAHLSQATENFGATLTNATNAFFGPLPTETQYQQKRTHSLLRTDLDDGPDADSEIQQSGDEAEAEAGEHGATGGADGGALLASWVQSSAAAVRNTLESLAQEPERAGRREQERSNGRGILDGDGSDSSPGASSEETEEENGEDGAAGGAEDEGEDDAGYGWWGMPVPSWTPPRVAMPNLDAITTIVSGGSQALGESMSRGVDRLEELANQSADKIGEAQAKVNEKASSFFREVVSDWKEGLAQANATANRMMDLSAIQDEIEQKRQKESAGATSPKQGEEAEGSGPLPASSLAEYSPESGSGSDAPGESPLAHGAPPCQLEPADLPKETAECEA